MYKYIKANIYPENEGGLSRSVHSTVAQLINDPYGSKLYGKIANMQNDAVIPYIEGIMAMAEVADINIKGLNDLYELIISNGARSILGETSLFDVLYINSVDESAHIEVVAENEKDARNKAKSKLGSECYRVISAVRKD